MSGESVGAKGAAARQEGKRERGRKKSRATHLDVGVLEGRGDVLQARAVVHLVEHDDLFWFWLGERAGLSVGGGGVGARARTALSLSVCPSLSPITAGDLAVTVVPQQGFW